MGSRSVEYMGPSLEFNYYFTYKVGEGGREVSPWGKGWVISGVTRSPPPSIININIFSTT